MRHVVHTEEPAPPRAPHPGPTSTWLSCADARHTDTVNREERERDLADFLRGRRERITPADVGLPAGPRRRTPGLRREEVAQLAYISTEYYTRLEQARAPRPSREVLAQLARALRLSDPERDHLHHLAGVPPSPPPGPSREVRPSIVQLLDRLPEAAAIVLSATYEVIAWNNLAAALMEDFSVLPRRDRNMARRTFLSSRKAGEGCTLYGVPNTDEFARTMAQHLRATAARYPEDPEVSALVHELRTHSPEFATLWATHEVAPRPTLCKTFQHPTVGFIAMHCDVLDITDRDQRVFIYTAAPGSEEAMRLLSVIGTQRMDVPS
ncbi:helix-turn-helix domain-containing protein [Streptomyces sp. SID335]|nr:helix-turn-helix domain-containing protein [Streptomyces sp. SID335]MYZ18275.1 helix-turn-helix domain-containing protein [Streptomyces sp. SID337]NDZ92252.1 helix-turn-helix domain-containing protein [Streptomyces sp. SID10115]NDZ97994.1 helix-turn-helix domain-containing protein [Streptomyces sp. SID10116]NEB44909.1 helix-turn-helix domain-containing protein [Streptomyces sp. SID339]